MPRDSLTTYKRKLYLDIETYCERNLKNTSVYPYTEHDSFEILMCAYAWDDDPVRVLVGEEAIKRELLKALVDPTVLKVAHNAQFERVCFTRFFPEKRDQFDFRVYLDPRQWDDTMARAGVWGHPQSLAKLAVALGAEEKDEAGTRLINLFSMPYRGKRVAPSERPDEWMDFIAYCSQDVETLRDIDRRLGSWIGRERDVWLRDQLINDRGIKLDTSLAHNARNAAESNAEEMIRELAALLHVDNPNSVQQFRVGMLETFGIDMPDCRADTVKSMLGSGDLDPGARRALELRQDLALAASKKYAAALNYVSDDGRLRGSFRYFGAHTGRWSGRGLQPQNLPRAQLKTEDDTDAAILDLSLGLGADPYTLKALVRSLFVGPFTVVDYSAIEARVVAWLAGEQWALDAFAKGRDIYVETAERMGLYGHGVRAADVSPEEYKEGRSKGKVAVLALGYNGAVGSLRAMGAEDDDNALAELVAQWRSANPNIVRFWKELEVAFRHGGRAGQHIRVEKDGDSRYVWLPSGRPIAYHGYKIRSVKRPGWDEPRQLITFLDPTRRFPYIDTYGGRLTENVTQAVARDLLGYALITLVDNGSHVVGHVHDEVICEKGWIETTERLMCATPLWAKGLPVTGEGMQCRRYRK